MRKISDKAPIQKIPMPVRSFFDVRSMRNNQQNEGIPPGQPVQMVPINNFQDILVYSAGTGELLRADDNIARLIDEFDQSVAALNGAGVIVEITEDAPPPAGAPVFGGYSTSVAANRYTITCPYDFRNMHDYLHRTSSLLHEAVHVVASHKYPRNATPQGAELGEQFYSNYQTQADRANQFATATNYAQRIQMALNADTDPSLNADFREYIQDRLVYMRVKSNYELDTVLTEMLARLRLMGLDHHSATYNEVAWCVNARYDYRNPPPPPPPQQAPVPPLPLLPHDDEQ